MKCKKCKRELWPNTNYGYRHKICLKCRFPNTEWDNLKMFINYKHFHQVNCNE